MMQSRVVLLFFTFVVAGLALTTSPPSRTKSGPWVSALYKDEMDNNVKADASMVGATRRDIIIGLALSTAAVAFQQPAMAIPMVTNDEFSSLLRDSSLSIKVVEFSGARSEDVIVKLVDGTAFGIKDVIESSTDPRSPLKLAAACRENNVKTKFTDLESILASTPKRKKVYTNERVQKAAEKEKEREERMRIDEEERIAQLEIQERQSTSSSR